MLPFPAFDSAAITAEKDAVSRCHNFRSSVPYGFLQSNNVTSLSTISSRQGVDVADTFHDVDRCCAKVERAERGLLQPRLRPGLVVFLAGGLSPRLLPPSLFPNKSPPPFTQFQVFSTQVLLACVLPTCWVQHSHHTPTSPSSTLLLTRVCPPSIPPLLALGPTFSAAAAVSLLCYRRHGGRGKRFRCVRVHYRQSMLLAGLHRQTSSRTNQCHEGTLIHGRTL